MEKFEIRPRPQNYCEAMRGLVEELQRMKSVSKTARVPFWTSLSYGMQRIEHYEIAAYRTDIAPGKGARRTGTGGSFDVDA